VDVGSQGRVYGGTQDGKIMRLLPDGGLETFAETHGRPLGLHFDKDGNLIVCDAYKELLSIDENGRITTLATSAESIPFKFTDDLDIASSGVIYFSAASDTYAQNEYLYDLMEAKAHGRLMSYDPATGTVKVLLKNLYFANGVALSRDEDFVLVNETYRYRITRYWLKGLRPGPSTSLLITCLDFQMASRLTVREPFGWLFSPSETTSQTTFTHSLFSNPLCPNYPARSGPSLSLTA